MTDHDYTDLGTTFVAGPPDRVIQYWCVHCKVTWSACGDGDECPKCDTPGITQQDIAETGYEW